MKPRLVMLLVNLALLAELLAKCGKSWPDGH